MNARCSAELGSVRISDQCSFPMRLGKIYLFYLLLCFQDTLKIFTLLVHAKSACLARSRCPALAWKLIRHLARKKARTILPSFLASQSPTAKPSLSPTEDPTSGSSCCRTSQSLTSGKNAARVQASFVPEFGPTSVPQLCALAVSTWQGRLPGTTSIVFEIPDASR